SQRSRQIEQMDDQRIRLVGVLRAILSDTGFADSLTPIPPVFSSPTAHRDSRGQLELALTEAHAVILGRRSLDFCYDIGFVHGVLPPSPNRLRLSTPFPIFHNSLGICCKNTAIPQIRRCKSHTALVLGNDER